jgi:hypothetical protein
MSKATKKRATTSPKDAGAGAATGKTAGELTIRKTDPSSKQSRVVAMLQSPEGTTLAAMMKATGWQKHSVRGFLAGVVRKKLKLKLSSKEIDGNRVYRIDRGKGTEAAMGKSKRRPA